MDHRKLRSFLALSRTLHFARAAEEVCLSQPALTYHIQSLEQSWDIRLFERDKRHVSLTPEGKLLAVEVEKTLQRMDGLSRTIKLVSGGGLALLRLGYVGTSVLEPLLVSGIRMYRKDWPEVSIEPNEYSVSEQYSLLQSGEIDVGIIRGPIPEHRHIAHRAIHQSFLKLIVADDHALASATSVSLSDLKDETLIMQDDPEGFGLGATVSRVCAEAGIIPVNIIRTKDVSTAINLAAIGLGITFIPSSRAIYPRRDVVSVSLACDTAVTVLYLCWNERTKNKEALRFVQHIESIFKDNENLIQ